jgi:hypothetical protein
MYHSVHSRFLLLPFRFSPAVRLRDFALRRSPNPLQNNTPAQLPLTHAQPVLERARGEGRVEGVCRSWGGGGAVLSIDVEDG